MEGDFLLLFLGSWGAHVSIRVAQEVYWGRALGRLPSQGSAPRVPLKAEVLLKMLLFMEIPGVVHMWSHSHVQKCCV